MYVLIDDSIGYSNGYEVLGYTETLEDAEDISVRIEMAKGLSHKPKIIENPKLLNPKAFIIPEYTTVKVWKLLMPDAKYNCCFSTDDCITHGEVYYGHYGYRTIEVYIKEPTRDSNGDPIPAEDILDDAKEKGIEILKNFNTLRAVK